MCVCVCMWYNEQVRTREPTCSQGFSKCELGSPLKSPGLFSESWDRTYVFICMYIYVFACMYVCVCICMWYHEHMCSGLAFQNRETVHTHVYADTCVCRNRKTVHTHVGFSQNREIGRMYSYVCRHMCMSESQDSTYTSAYTCVCTVSRHKGQSWDMCMSESQDSTVHTHVYVSRLTIHAVHTHVYVSRLPFRTCVCDVARRYMHMYIDMCVYECMCVYSYICGTLNTWALSLSSGIARLDMYIYMSVWVYVCVCIYVLYGEQKCSDVSFRNRETVHTRVHIYTFVWMYVCVCIYMWYGSQMGSEVAFRNREMIHIYVYSYVCMYVCVCTHIYVVQRTNWLWGCFSESRDCTYIRAMTHSYMWQDSCICVAWLIYTCAITHL